MCRKLTYLISFVLVLALAGTNVAFGQLVWESSITDDMDDVEQQPGRMYMDSSDLEILDGQIIGLRYPNVRIPQGVLVVEAWIQFQVDETKGGTQPVSVLIDGELSPNAPKFVSTDLTNVSDRPRTEAKVVWNVPPTWTTVGARGPDQRTPDISSIINEIVNQPGWVSGNALVLILGPDPDNPTQQYTRCAEAGPGDDSATLHIEYFTTIAHATKPSPADGAIDVPRDVTLSWEPGDFVPPVNGHTVYLSESFDDVNAGIGGVTQSAASYAPAQRLDFSKTYYWRVDEVNGPPDFTVHPGKIWSFTTELFSYPIENITATASSQFNVDSGPEKTIDGSGLDDNDLHSTEEAAIWVSSMTGAQPTWIQYEFDGVYKLHQMWVWNHNTSIEPILGFGVKDVTIEYSSDGANWATLDTTHEFARAPGMPGYAHNTTVDMAGVPAKYVKLTANSNWGGVLPQYGLSEVRFFYIPVLAREPDPASGATDVPVATIGQTIDVFLSFIAGREAASHNVYFSTDQQAVIDGTAPVTTVSQASYGPLSLDLDKTYYWRVDEVNEAETPTTWQGNVWNFSTQKSLVVDDFEDYNDFEPDRIFDTWIDGWGVATNGSQVGYAEPSFVEKKIVHGGAQSMPFFYDNTGGVAYSEAERTWAVPQDWNWKGVTALVLWFRGNPVAFQESPPGTFTMSADGADIWGSRDEFRYAYKQLNGNGSIVAQVLSVDHTHNWAKAGPMIRETLDPGSKFAAVYITPGNGCRFQLRSTTNGSASSDSSVATAEQKAITAAYWVKLERSGNAFSAYYSSDPATDPWHLMVWSPQTIAMPPNVYIGLALTSHASGVTCVAKFSDVSTTGAVTGPWQVAEIGVAQPANTAAPLYVSLADSANKTATVKHPDAAATTISAWTQWNVDLAEFTGVNPRSIKKMIIGVGDKANPQPASGLVYFDDIGLYPPQPAQ